MWKISKASCEDLEIRYPTEVFGQVDIVLFDELKAIFNIVAVQDDSIQLPESVVVPLEELFPTKMQEEKSLNIDLTADAIDRYRFFQNYLWFAWDEDLESNEMWTSAKYLIPRLKLYYDLKNKSISKSLSAEIRRLIQEAKYIQKKRENLEVTINDDEDDTMKMGDSPESVSKLLKLHLRLNKIKHELEILINPEMRVVYEKMKETNRAEDSKSHQIFVVTANGTLQEQIDSLERLKGKINETAVVRMTDKLQDALLKSHVNDEIYLPSGTHTINFLEYLNDNLLITGARSYYHLPTNEFSTENLHKTHSIVKAEDNDSLLLAIDGDVRLENLVIDCNNVKSGILVKSGANVTMKNCLIHGDLKSSVTEAFSIFNDAKVTLENCVIINFALGFSVNDSATLILKNSTVKDCNNSILCNGKCEIVLENCSILDSKEYGITKIVSEFETSKKMTLINEFDNQDLDK